MLHLVKGDITGFAGDVIVNAANSSLMGGGGVDGAIHRAAGKSVLQECKDWVKLNGELRPGGAMFTRAGKLDLSHIVHTVGPVWRGGSNSEEQLLANCYINSLRLSRKLGAKEIAFPNISTGVYRYPKKDAAELAVATVKNFESSISNEDLNVYFYCFDEENYQLYQSLLKL